MKAKHKRYLLVAAFTPMTVTLLLIVGCAPKENTVDKPDDNPIVQLPEWSIDSECNNCHTVEVASMSDDATAASAHPTLSCISCHPDTNGRLTDAHENYSGSVDPTRLMFTKIFNDTCTGRGCHNDEDLATATASSTVFVELTGSAVNPHDLPDCPEHNDKVLCASCHKIHLPMSGAVDTASGICGGCHHDGYYEPCSDCHDEEH